MSRVSSSVAKHARKKKIMDLAKGFRGGRSKLLLSARDAVEHAMLHAYIGRKQRKRQFRNLWIARINAAARLRGITYSTLMNSLKSRNIILNRKILADLAVTDARAFDAIVEKASGK